MQADILLPIGAYLILVFSLSIYAYRKRQTNNTLAQYFIGDRSMGGFLLAMTLATTYVSASSFLSGPGAAYHYGLGWVLLSMIQLPAIWLSLSLLGKKFAILARRYNAVTLNDMLFARYNSRLLIWLASFSLLVAFMGAMTVQFIGGARLLETATGIPYGIGLLIFGLTTVAYTSFGGFHASILNDALQGMVMLLGAILLLIAVICAAGGLPQAIITLKAINPQLLSPQGIDNALSPSFMASFWVLVCFGVVGLPHTAIRCISYRDSKAVHSGIIIGTIVIAVLMLCMHLAGVIGRAVLPNITVPDRVIPALMIKVLPPIAAGIFLAAPLAAIMSTVNSQLLQSSATLIKDLYLNFKPISTIGDKQLARLSTGVTLVIGLLLILAAWHPPDMIIWLNLLAFGGLQAVFLWPLLFGLYWPRANAIGALTSMIIGATSYSLLTAFNFNFFNFHPIMPSLLLALLAFICGNAVGQTKGVKQIKIANTLID